MIPAKPLEHQRSFLRRRLNHQHKSLWYCVRVGNPPFQFSGPSVPVVLTEAPQAKGETPPQDRGKHGPQQEEIPTTSGETSPQDMGKKRSKAPDSEGEGAEKTETKQGEVLPKDKRALEATSSDYSTESDEGGEVLASSSTNPWQRRVRLRTALDAKTRLRTLLLLSVMVKRVWQWLNNPPGLVARRVEARQRYMVSSNLAKSLLQVMPKTLGFEWCPSGPCGTLLQWLAKGQDRAAELPQCPELRLSRRFPGWWQKSFGPRRLC